MSGTLNKVMLIGHLGDDVKIKHFDNGGCIARFPMATNETYTNKSTNEKVTNTDWHNIVLRNKAAEICEKYLSKGDKVYVEGKLRTRKWQGDDGADRYTTEVNVDEFTSYLQKKSLPLMLNLMNQLLQIIRQVIRLKTIYHSRIPTNQILEFCDS